MVFRVFLRVLVLFLLLAIGLKAAEHGVKEGRTIGEPVARANESERAPPLDVPSGHAPALEEEDGSEETIFFYGTAVEGDAFFWCLDRSGSMEGSRLTTLKDEVESAVTSLSSQAEFGLVAYSQQVLLFRPRPVRARPTAKAQAIGWVQALIAAGSTYMSPAGVSVLELASLSTRQRPQILWIGDGLPTGESAATVLGIVTSSNFQQVPIHTYYVGEESGGRALLESIALSNHGRFTEIN